MIKVYEAIHGAQAKLILDLLTHANLKARIDGEYLEGGIGSLQASGLVKVMISESDYEQGKKLIKQWEDQEIEENWDND